MGHGCALKGQVMSHVYELKEQVMSHGFEPKEQVMSHGWPIEALKIYFPLRARGERSQNASPISQFDHLEHSQSKTVANDTAADARTMLQRCARHGDKEIPRCVNTDTMCPCYPMSPQSHLAIQ